MKSIFPLSQIWFCKTPVPTAACAALGHLGQVIRAAPSSGRSATQDKTISRLKFTAQQVSMRSGWKRVSLSVCIYRQICGCAYFPHNSTGKQHFPKLMPLEINSYCYCCQDRNKGGAGRSTSLSDWKNVFSILG